MERLQFNGMLYGTFVATLLMTMIAAVPSAYPEAYIGGQIGTTLAGNTLKSVELTDFTLPGSMSDRSLATSALFGLKAGYYFPKVRWFGIETEFYQTNPNIKQQNTRITIQPGSSLRDFGTVTGGTSEGVLSGDHLRIRTWVPINFMFRYYKTRLQPYVGFGPGIFMAHITTTTTGFEGTQNSTRLGLNAKLGGEYFFTRHLTAFAELKYNYTNFDFPANNTGSFGFKATYNPILLAFGMSFHF